MSDTPAPAGQQPTPKRDVDVRWLFRMGAIVVLLGAFATFAVQNSESVEVEFLSWSFEAPQIILLSGSAVAGILIWELGGFFRRRKHRDG